MITDIFKFVNWVDIIVLIIILRGCYVAAQAGFAIEAFRLIGLVFAVFFGMHYYTALGDYVGKKIGLGSIMPLEFVDFLSFVFLTVGINLLFAALRKTFLNTFKVEAPTSINKWGGLALGVCRSIIYTGYIMFLLVISTVGYFKGSVNSSYVGGTFFKVTPSVYSYLWNNVGSKFMANEDINKNVFEVESRLRSKEK